MIDATKRSRSAAARRRGFTLLEVMIGLALLGFGLVVLIKSTTGNIKAAKRAQMMGVATDLSRAKMYDIEEKLLKEGFTETDQSEDGKTFDEEGWPEIKYSYKVELVELPSFDQLQEIAKGKGSAAGSGARGKGAGSGSDAEAEDGSFENSALGGIIQMMGGGFGGGGGGQDIDSKMGGSFIQTYYQIVQETLKASIRKVTLTLKFEALGEESELTTIAFFTDPAGLNKGMFGGLDALTGGAGEGSGSSGKGGGGGSTGGGTGGGSGSSGGR